ncbi:lipoprotein-releasing ABC transporter permease subunit [Suttonella sp. R2A3]|uniref:lipoprotein-releasing ABC transporter permease subunit n=1 Tax=Suttonella sp. R2A3 TaxID=2908648 RepID=UPI001F244A14|nr:lipoprotein-releasing ABC transporter permease subunit [Suttonella sp. R2A3]UJF24364.1 lipoprotein-releasing ABC transporter permease subunit [Suttonella sp. R2A3]
MNALPAKIGLRYAYARRGSSFIGLNAILAIIGITIGIAALIVVLSVMNGVVSQVRDKMLSMTAHASIRPSFATTMPAGFDPTPYLSDEQHIVSFAPIVQGQGLIGDGRSFQGVLLQGVDPEQQSGVSETFAEVPQEVREQLTPGSFNLILGSELVTKIGAEVGDKITIIVPEVTASAAGLMPRLKRFTLIGTFHSGHIQFDSSLALTNIQDAGKLLRLPPQPSSYVIMLDDPLKAPLVRGRLQSKLPGNVYASDWSLDQSVYFSTVQTEKNAMFIILCLIILVAAFGLLSSMYMVVNEKRRDIAILRTMGMTRNNIRRLFLTQGMIFGGIGTLLGVSLGVIISLNIPAIMDFLQRQTGYALPKTMYLIEELSAKIDPNVIIGVSAVALILTLLFSVIPAHLAAKTEPARALSQE